MEFILSLIILNLEPTYDVFAPIIMCNKWLRKTWKRCVKPEHRIEADMGAKIIRWSQAACEHTVIMTIGLTQRNFAKYWHGSEPTLTHKRVDMFDVHSLGFPPRTYINIRGNHIIMHEYVRNRFVVIRTESGRSAMLKPGASRRQKRKFVEVARYVCSALGMTAQEMLSEALDALSQTTRQGAVDYFFATTTRTAGWSFALCG